MKRGIPDIKTIRTLLALLLVLALGVSVSFGETAADGMAEAPADSAAAEESSHTWEKKTFSFY